MWLVIPIQESNRLLLSHFSHVRLLRPHRRQPTRLPCSWDSPGKNTGVGCHFLFQCMKVKSESEVTHSCLNLCDPMDCSLPGSSIHGIFQARVLEWGAFAFSLIAKSYLFSLAFLHPTGRIGKSLAFGTLLLFSHSVMSDSWRPMD